MDGFGVYPWLRTSRPAEALSVETANRARVPQLQKQIQVALHVREGLKSQLERLAQHDGHVLMRYRVQILRFLLMDAAMQSARADMGNIQLFDPALRALRIVEQRGFGSLSRVLRVCAFTEGALGAQR